MKASFAAIAITLVALSPPGPALAEVPDTGDPGLKRTSAHDADRPMTMREFRRWQRNWDRRLREMFETDPEHYAWGREKRPIKAYTVVLDPPLARVGPADKVTVEWFHSPIDERGGRTVWKHALVTILRWSTGIRDAGEDRVNIMPRLVSEGPGLPPRFTEQRRLIQDMVNAWGDNALYEPIWTPYAELTRTNWTLSRLTEEQARQILDDAGEFDATVWRAKRELPQTRARGELADSRYREAMRQAIAQNARYLNTPQDPVLLIDGKYLLTGYVTGRTKNLFRMANSIVRERLEGMPSYGFALADISWGAEREPRRGEVQVMQRVHEDPSEDKVDVEWLYTYIDEDGRRNAQEELDKLTREWLSSVHRAGIFEVRIHRTPAGQWTREPTRWTAHHRTHQGLVLAWGEDHITASGVEAALRGAIRRDPRSVGSTGDAQEVLERAGAAGLNWRVRREEARERMELATARALATGSRKRGPKAPVFVVDGRYRVDGRSAGGTAKAFQILNWLVRQQLEGLEEKDPGRS